MVLENADSSKMLAVLALDQLVEYNPMEANRGCMALQGRQLHLCGSADQHIISTVSYKLCGVFFEKRFWEKNRVGRSTRVMFLPRVGNPRSSSEQA
jgi:hypothetical protein